MECASIREEEFSCFTATETVPAALTACRSGPLAPILPPGLRAPSGRRESPVRPALPDVWELQGLPGQPVPRDPPDLWVRLVLSAPPAQPDLRVLPEPRELPARPALPDAWELRGQPVPLALQGLPVPPESPGKPAPRDPPGRLWMYRTMSLPHSSIPSTR